MTKATDIPDLEAFVSLLTDEQKQNLLTSLNSQLDIKPLNTPKEADKVKKNRGRPKKVKPVTKARGKKANPLIEDDHTPLEENEDKVAEASKILNESRKPIKIAPRKPTKLIKVICGNCKREIEVAENFPNIKNFICCIK